MKKKWNFLPKNDFVRIEKHFWPKKGNFWVKIWKTQFQWNLIRKMDSLTHFNKKNVYFYVQHINILKVTVLEKFMQFGFTAPLSTLVCKVFLTIFTLIGFILVTRWVRTCTVKLLFCAKYFWQYSHRCDIFGGVS